MEIEYNSLLPRKYIQFPIFLLKEMFENKTESINSILNYGVYKFSISIDYDLRNVARQVIYKLYNDLLGPNIKGHILDQNYEYIGKDEDYRGFSVFTDIIFNPEDEIEELLLTFKESEGFKEYCIKNYCIWHALELLNLKGDSESILFYGEMIQNKCSTNEVLPMVGVHNLFEFRNHDKSNFEIAQFLAFIAIRSILGKKKFAKTNKNHILSRMFGYSTFGKVELNKLSKNQSIYLKRYHIDKVFLSLEMHWNICIYSNRTRGIYVSFKKEMPLGELARIAELKKQTSHKKEFLKLKQTKICTALNTS
jgi:hypothetical protein